MSRRSTLLPAALGALTNQSARKPEQPYTIPKQFVQTAIDPLADKMVNSTELNPDFTGLARSIICVNNQGFNNFQICTLYIEKGVVVKIEKSDMWANFETIAMMDLINHYSMIHLNGVFEHGKALQK